MCCLRVVVGFAVVVNSLQTVVHAKRVSVCFERAKEAVETACVCVGRLIEQGAVDGHERAHGRGWPTLKRPVLF